MAGPLEGVRVVDCTRGTAGPRATGILADYGADVIWVEPPGGDPYRDALAVRYAVYNRGKRSVVLDLRDDADHARMVELLRSADVFVESWRPGVAERLGLHHAAVHETAPWVVTTSISGFGVDGPLRDVPGYEALVHALVGTMGEQRGWREGPIFEGLPFASLGASSLAVIGTLAALYRRADDGVGRHVETSLYDGALAYLTMGWSDFDEPVPALLGPRVTKRLIVRSFCCADDQWLGVHTGAVGAFGRCMEALGLADRVPPSPDGLDMSLTPTPEEITILDEEVPAILASEPRDVWLKRLLDADVCAIPVLRPTESYDEAQPRHNEMVRTVDDPVLGPVEQVSPPATFAGTPAGASRPAPRVGEHTTEVLADLVPRQLASTAAVTDRPLLDGVEVLDFGAYYAGPYANRLLADLGARVVKLETLAGDPLRGQERVFPSGHAGKRSIAVDLKDADGQVIGRRLAARADVVAHNMRPGAAERLGLGYDQVAADNPDVVYAYSPGWGSTGPDHRRQGFAPMYSGYAGVSFEVAGRGNPPVMPAGNEDPGNGLLGAIGILMALVHRRAGGPGQLVEHPQLNATMAHLAHIVRRADGEVLGAGTLDAEQLGVGPRERLYRTADGWVCVVAPDDDAFARLRAVLGLADPATDGRDAMVASGPEHRATDADDRSAQPAAGPAVDSAGEWAAEVEQAAAAMTTAALTAALAQVDVPHAVPVPFHCETFLNDAENARTGRSVESPHARLGHVREVGKLVRISDAAVPLHLQAPELGEHTDEVLRDLGYDAATITELRRRHVVR